MRRPYRPQSTLRALTGRHQQIAELVGRAYSNKRIAQELNIAEQTVKNHLHTIFNQLGIDDRVSLALLVVREERQKEAGGMAS